MERTGLFNSIIFTSHNLVISFSCFISRNKRIEIFWGFSVVIARSIWKLKGDLFWSFLPPYPNDERPYRIWFAMLSSTSRAHRDNMFANMLVITIEDVGQYKQLWTPNISHIFISHCFFIASKWTKTRATRR